jgi:tetraacyldisaccharide 4'-kinase
MTELQWKAIISGHRRDLSASILRAGLRIASFPYGAAIRGRNLGFNQGWIRSTRVDRPVISVGNLTVGGTGKTPVVEWVARWFREHGRRVAILSRGYGSEDGPNDEALVLEENLPDVPHLQGKDRVALAKIGIEELDAELFVLDDGFQHRRLKRDLDIVLVDALNPFGNGRLFPAGPLREPISSLRRAGLILLTRADEVDQPTRDRLKTEVERWAAGTPIGTVSFPAIELQGLGRASLPVAGLVGRQVASFCGIGHPEAFHRTVERLGAKILATRTFPDHHPYRGADIEDLARWGRECGAEILVTTQKDLVKIRLGELRGQPLWAVRIGAVVTDGKGKCDELLDDVLSTLS